MAIVVALFNIDKVRSVQHDSSYGLSCWSGLESIHYTPFSILPVVLFDAIDMSLILFLYE